MAQSRWNSSLIRALRHGTRAPVRESAAKSHMPHATHGTCDSCVWGVTWGYVRAAVEQPSTREAREARARARDDRGAARTGGGGWSWRPRRHATRLEPRGALRRTTPSSIHRCRTAAWPVGGTALQQTFRRFSNGWSCSWSGSRVSSEYTTPTRSHSRNHALRSVNGSSRHPAGGTSAPLSCSSGLSGEDPQSAWRRRS